MEALPFLHAAHQVRQAFDGLRAASWLAIGLGIGALILTWGRLAAWIRTPEPRPPAVVRWGEDEAGWYFELTGAEGETWAVTGGAWQVALTQGSDGLFRPRSELATRPEAVVSSGGVRLRL